MLIVIKNSGYVTENQKEALTNLLEFAKDWGIGFFTTCSYRFLHESSIDVETVKTYQFFLFQSLKLVLRIVDYWAHSFDGK